MIMNRKITSVALSLLFIAALALTSCSSSRKGGKAKSCPAYGGDIKTLNSEKSSLPA